MRGGVAGADDVSSDASAAQPFVNRREIVARRMLSIVVERSSRRQRTTAPAPSRPESAEGRAGHDAHDAPRQCPGVAPVPVGVPPEPPLPPARVRDLVDVAAVRTVVRISDLDDPRWGPELAASFVLTPDADLCLRTLLRDVRAGRGRGYFVEGAFGAGKSHLLAVLLGLLRGSLTPADLGAPPVGEGLAGGNAGLCTEGMPSRPLLAVPVSLVDYAASEGLEQAVLRSAARALGNPEIGSGGRRATFEALAARIAADGYGGLVLGLDELSEFLRSKRDGRALAEDVRFLQFLGEWAESAPAWVLCGVQEAVEQTGELPAAMFSKIRDRYPVRFRLGGDHVKELISRRLVQRRAGAEPALIQLYDRLRQTFGTLPFGVEDFVRLYPVHPATVDLLDDLRALFSAHRGVVDFITARLAGDPARRIVPFLDQPADRLLCPDVIVAHFRDRIRDRPETAPLASVALPFFEREYARLFPDESTARLALSLGRVLIAGALCPTPRTFSARELADALLYRLTDLDPRLNLAYVSETLERMAALGAYVGRAEGAGQAPGQAKRPAGHPGRETRYFCDLQADIALVTRRRLEYWRGTLLPDDERAWAVLLPWCDHVTVPLARMKREAQAVWDVSWRHTLRRVAVRLQRVSALPPEEARELARLLEISETDAVLLVAEGLPAESGRAAAHWRSVLAPAIRALQPKAPILLWAPRPPSAAEHGLLLDAVARALLEAEVAAERSAAAGRIALHLQSTTQELRQRIAALYRDLYVEGVMLDVDGRGTDLRPLATAPFAALLETVCDLPLGRRFPLHPDLLARPEWLTPAAVERAVAVITGAGERAGGAVDAEARAVLDQFLVPLGLCRRSAHGYRLSVDACPGSPAGDLLALVGDAPVTAPAGLDALYGRQRKGDIGLERRTFSLVWYSLVRAGALTAVHGIRRLPPTQVHYAERSEVDALASGGLVDDALQPGLQALSFLPPRLRASPLTYASQREAWDAVLPWQRAWLAALPELNSELAAVRDFPSLRPILTPALTGVLERLEEMLHAVFPSLTPREGLGRLCAAVIARPGARQTLEQAAALREFLEHRLSPYLHMVGYVAADDFRPPEALASDVSALRALMQDGAVVLGEGFARLQGMFRELRAAYAVAYVAAHATAVGPAAAAAHEQVRSSPGYRLASLLADIPGMPGCPGEPPLQEALAAALGACCAVEPAALHDRLHRLPTCRCGFRLDQAPAVSTADALHQRAVAAASVYLRALRLPQHADHLRAYAAGLSAVGRQEAASALIGLLAPPAGGAVVLEDAWRIIAGGGAEDLRAALAGRAPVVERDGEALLAGLCGAAALPDQVVRVVREWLGELAPGALVRITRASPGRPEPGAERGPAPDDRMGAHVDDWRRQAIEAAHGRDDLALGGDPSHVAAGDPRGQAAWATLRGVRRVMRGLTALQAIAHTPEPTVAAWESWWLGPAGQVARELAELDDAAALSGCRGDLPLRRWQAEFMAADTAAQGPFATTLAALPPEQRGALTAAVAQTRDLARSAPGDLYLWCLDAWRCDLMPLVLDVLSHGGVALRVVHRGVGWAAAPTTTAPQFDALRSVNYQGELLHWEHGLAEAMASDSRNVLTEISWRGGAGDGCICKWGFVDAKVHSCTQDYGSFCAELRAQCGRQLLPAFLALRPGDRVVLCADHGFRQISERLASDSPAFRYRHGGESIEEVFAPWCVVEIV